MGIDKLAEKIQYERKKRLLSQEALASKLGLRRQSISRWESGEGYPELETLIQLSKCLDVSVDYLLNDTISTGYEADAAYNTVQPPVSTRSPARWWGLFGGIGGIIVGLNGITALWIISILDPAPVLGPALGLLRAYWHYLEYNGRTQLFWGSVAILVLGVCLVLFGLMRRRRKAAVKQAEQSELPQNDTEKENAG